jgi:Protein of unknown function (DUF5131)
MNETSIIWTEATWNPASGCERITEGCKFCYALALAERRRGTPAFPNGSDLTLRPHKLLKPSRLKRPSRGDSRAVRRSGRWGRGLAVLKGRDR